MQIPTAPLAKLGLALQTGEPFSLTEEERADAEKAFLELERMRLTGKYPKHKTKKQLMQSLHKMLGLALQLDDQNKNASDTVEAKENLP